MEARYFVRELRLQYVRTPVEGNRHARPRHIRTPQDAAAYLRPLLQAEPFEVFIVLCLGTTGRPLGVVTMGRGALDSALVTPRAVFTAALLANARSIITVHNHPSGEAQPSADDVALWARIDSSGELLNVEVLDHMIIGSDETMFSKRAEIFS